MVANKKPSSVVWGRRVAFKSHYYFNVFRSTQVLAVLHSPFSLFTFEIPHFRSLSVLCPLVLFSLSLNVPSPLHKLCLARCLLLWDLSDGFEERPAPGLVCCRHVPSPAVTSVKNSPLLVSHGDLSFLKPCWLLPVHLCLSKCSPFWLLKDFQRLSLATPVKQTGVEFPSVSL